MPNRSPQGTVETENLSPLTYKVSSSNWIIKATPVGLHGEMGEMDIALWTYNLYWPPDRKSRWEGGLGAGG